MFLRTAPADVPGWCTSRAMDGTTYRDMARTGIDQAWTRTGIDQAWTRTGITPV